VERPPASVDAKKHRNSADFAVWHRRLGHLSMGAIKVLFGQDLVRGAKPTGAPGDCDTPCPVCVETKLKPKGRKSIGRMRSTAPLELVHVDNVEGFTCESFGNRSGYLFVDDWSRATFFYPVKRKSDFLGALQSFCARVANDSRSVKQILIKALQTDFAGELSAGKTAKWCAENGIRLQHSAPGSHAENGIVEKAIDTVKACARTLSKQAGFPASLWLLPMLAACHILQFVPHSAFGITAYQRFNWKDSRYIAPSNTRVSSVVLHMECWKTQFCHRSS
jgi:transposase InsO family protein